MISKEKIQTLVDEKIADNDFFVVDLKVSADNKISVYVDGIQGVTIDDCVAISRHIEGNLDREEEDFELEVSSAGIGLPFKVLQQYVKNIGRTVEVVGKDGKKLEGTLKEADAATFTIEYEERVKLEGKKRKVNQLSQSTFSYDEVKSTKLLLKL